MPRLEETHLIRRGRSPDQEAREQAREPPVQVLVHPGVVVRAEAGIEQPVSLGEIVMRARAEAEAGGRDLLEPGRLDVAHECRAQRKAGGQRGDEAVGGVRQDPEDGSARFQGLRDRGLDGVRGVGQQRRQGARLHQRGGGHEQAAAVGDQARGARVAGVEPADAGAETAGPGQEALDLRAAKLRRNGNDFRPGARGRHDGPERERPAGHRHRGQRGAVRLGQVEDGGGQVSVRAARCGAARRSRHGEGPRRSPPPSTAVR